MLRNYIDLSLRNLWRNRKVSAISIIGLAVGLAGGLVIFLLVSYLFSFDRYHANADRTYWLVTDIRHDNVTPADAVPRPLGEVLRRDYPFVESAVRLENMFGRIISVPDNQGRFVKKFEESRTVCFTEPQYFNVFDVEWVEGDPKSALVAPNTVVLSERYAQKYFGDDKPIGRILRFDNQVNLIVTGIIKNPPSNTKLRYDALISYSTIPVLMGGEGERSMQSWGNTRAMCFVTLRAGTPVEQLTSVFSVIKKKYMTAKEASMFDFHALPLSDLSHNPQYGGHAPRPILYALIIVGILLVLAACINFINLATARAMKRAKEVGVRKAIGSTRWQLIGQFMTETTLITLGAVVLALLLTQLSLPLLNTALAVLRADLSVLDLLQPRALAWFTALVLSVILLAGFYPALVTARFNPVTALRASSSGRLTTQQAGSVSIRRVLIVVQFFITQFFVIGVIVLLAQVRYLQKTELGFTKEAILTIPVPTQNVTRQQALRERLGAIPGVEQVALGADPPASFSRGPVPFTFDTRTEPEKFPTRVKVGDMNYVPLFGINLVAGRNFRTNDTTQTEALVNILMSKQLGFRSPGELLGKRLTIWGATRTIVGVVNDFHTDALKIGISPTTILNYAGENHMAALKINPASMPTTLKAVEKTWNGLFPEHVFKASFVDALLSELYLTEHILLGLAEAFSLMAILICCLGLYGLVAFMAEVKTKEIGVRKVLGANLSQLLGLFGREFSKLIVIGFMLAAPLGGFLMNNWLQGYAYHIELGWWFFALTLLIAVGITVLTISCESMKAVLTNPARILRME